MKNLTTALLITSTITICGATAEDEKSNSRIEIIVSENADADEGSRQQAGEQLQVIEQQLLEHLGAEHPQVITIRKRIEQLHGLHDRVKDADTHADAEESHNTREEREAQERRTLRDRVQQREERERRVREERQQQERREVQLRWEERRPEDRHNGNERQHEEMERVHALHEAAERLERSGLPDLARDLHQRAEQLEREIHQHQGGRHEPEAGLNELMENMHQLRGEVREIKEKLDHILHRLERRDDDHKERHSAIDVMPSEPAPLPGWWREQEQSSPPSEGPFVFGGIVINR